MEFTHRLEEDLARRDFPVGAMAYHPSRGLVDPFGGREDLREGFEEVHVPADIRVSAYYLNNRDPARWREHPAAEGEALGGMVDYPPMEALTPPPDGEGEEP